MCIKAKNAFRSFRPIFRSEFSVDVQEHRIIFAYIEGCERPEAKYPFTPARGGLAVDFRVGNLLEVVPTKADAPGLVELIVRCEVHVEGLAGLRSARRRT